ncbi:ComEA family DNA-binding protein [Corallincola holothuriorum]|nr:helix-hairpin-helix domain-containing protein [Corallincola holothuriorum]
MRTRIFHAIAFSAALLTTTSLSVIAKDADIDSSTASSSQQTIQINQASAEEIADALEGVGMNKAQAIVDYRNMYGPFTSLATLEAVKGIGVKTVEANSAKIAFDVPIKK